MNSNACQNAILVSIKIPGLEMDPGNPGQVINTFTGGILKELLIVELAAADLLAERPEAGVMSFLGWYLLNVTNVHQAGTTVWNVLRRLNLDRWAIVFRFDTDESVLRSIYPRGVVRLINDVTAEMQVAAAASAAVLALWQQALNCAYPEGDYGNE
jgi:hypothetical protein